jgi:hypothetical protein
MNVFISQTWGKWVVVGRALPLPTPTRLSHSKGSSRIAKKAKKQKKKTNKKQKTKKTNL